MLFMVQFNFLPLVTFQVKFTEIDSIHAVYGAIVFNFLALFTFQVKYLTTSLHMVV